MGIIEDIGEYPRDGRFYLLEEITDRAGFFVVNGLPVYGIVALEHKQAVPVRTALLELNTGIDLLPIRQDKETAAQTFDLVRMTAIPDQREADAFFALCRDHAKGDSGLTLREFFFAASKLFRQKSAQERRKAIGLFGELTMMDIGSKHGVDLSSSWQKVGTESKYDFSLDEFNIEVKTTTRREMIAPIKHAQLFNEDRNILCFCQIEKSPIGITLDELSQRLKDGNVCFTTLESRLALARELLSIEEGELETPYKLCNINFYECKDINPFLEVSDRVTTLTYEYDLTGLPTIPLHDVLT